MHKSASFCCEGAIFAGQLKDLMFKSLRKIHIHNGRHGVVKMVDV